MQRISLQKKMRLNGVISVEEEAWSSVTIRDARMVGSELKPIRLASGLMVTKVHIVAQCFVDR